MKGSLTRIFDWRPAPSAIGQARLVLSAHVVLLAVAISPVLLVEIPPMSDLPNHLARLHILAEFASEPALQENYRISSVLAPNILMDWILTALVRFFDAYVVGRFFVVFTMVLTYAGLVSLNFLFFKNMSIWPALALPLLYNHGFAWGFINFNFGVALVFLFFSLWISRKEESVLRDWCILLALSAILYFTHMLAFGIFAALVVAHGLAVARWRGELWRPGFFLRFAAGLAPLAIGFAVYFAWLGQYGLGRDGLEGERVTLYGDLLDKIRVLLSPTLMTGRKEDVFLLVAYLVLGLVLAVRGRLGLARHMGAPLLGLAMICVAMPSSLFGIWGVDFRFPPVLLMLGIAATQPARMAGAASAPAVGAAICLMLAFRLLTMWPHFQAAEEDFLEFRRATSQIAEGSRVLASFDRAPERLAFFPEVYWHLPQLAVIERNVFVPFIFTGTAQLRPSARNRLIDTPGGEAMSSETLAQGLDPKFNAEFGYRKLDAYHRVYWTDWPKNFDYLIRITPPEKDHGISEYLYDTRSYSFFDISRIRSSPKRNGLR